MRTSGTRTAIVVGAGIVGVCSALELIKRGFAVTVLDRLEPGEACSFGNAGILAAQAVVPLAVPGVMRDAPRMLLDRDGPLVVRLGSLHRTIPWLVHFGRSARLNRVTATADAMKALYSTTLELHEAFAREAGVPELIEPTRYLYVHRNPAALDVENDLAWKLRRSRGGEVEVLEGQALREAEPELGPLYTRAVRLGPLGRTTNPFRLTRAYADLVRRKGGIIKRTEVHALRPQGGRVTVETAAESLDADVAVVAAGAWSLALVKPLGLKLPLIAERGYHMTFADPGIRLRHVVSEAERHFGVSSMEMGLRVAGTEELGLADEPPAWRRAEVLARHARDLFPNANLSSPSRWMGPRPGTPDSLPAIGPLPGHPNIFLAAGHGHLGLTGAPNTGRIVAALAAGERLNMDLAPYAADRFMRGRSSAARERATA